MKKQHHLGFGLVPAIIIIALAIAAGMGTQKLIDSREAPPIDTDIATTTSDNQPSDDTRSYIPDVDPFPRGNEPEPEPEPPTDTRPNISTEGLHRACSTKNPCATGQQCISYEGYAGPSGPTYSTCEIRCSTDADCPGTLSCGNYADGPGYVCSQF